MEFKRNKETGILEAWKEEKYIGPIIAMGDNIRGKSCEDIPVGFFSLVDFIHKQDWIFAKTYAHKAPHEYVVRNNINGTDEEFMFFVDYIQKYGVEMYFWNYPNKYIFIDGYQYWVMRDDENDPTTVLNRCDLSLYKLSIEWRGEQAE